MNQLAVIEMKLSRPGERPARYASMIEAHAVARMLWARWRALNGVGVRRRAFALGHLASGRNPGRDDYSSMFETWPGDDHTRYFGEAKRPAMIVSDPYHAVKLPALRAHVESLGLVLQHPPNPFASFHYPGRTVFAAITRPGREVRWLDEQLAYEEQNLWRL